MTSEGLMARNSAISSMACGGTQPYWCWTVCRHGSSAASLVSYRGRTFLESSSFIAAVRYGSARFSTFAAAEFLVIQAMGGMVGGRRDLVQRAGKEPFQRRGRRG